MTRNRHSNDPYSYNASRYPRHEQAKEKNRRKSRAVGVVLGLVGVGATAFAATHSEPVSKTVHEASRNSPNTVTKTLSEADYLSTISAPVMSSVQDVLGKISTIKSDLRAVTGAETGRTVVPLGESEQEDGLNIDHTGNRLYFSSEYSVAGTRYLDNGGIEVVHDDQGTSVSISRARGNREQDIIFRNPNKNLAVDLTDLSQVVAVATAPETTIQSISARGTMHDQDNHDISWSTDSTESPLTVTFKQNSGEYVATANSDVLKTPYGVSNTETPSWEDIQEFIVDKNF